jgi:hypothetical protein
MKKNESSDTNVENLAFRGSVVICSRKSRSRESIYVLGLLQLKLLSIDMSFIVCGMRIFSYSLV